MDTVIKAGSALAFHKSDVASMGKTSLTGSASKDQFSVLPADKTRPFESILSDVTSAQQRRIPPGAVSYMEHKNNIMRIARSDPAEAAALAHGYAFNSLSGELLDCSDRPNIRYSATGELVTPETTAYFARTHLAMQRERTELYQTELFKGTPPVEILEKIFNFNESMPTRFLEMSGW